MDHQAARRHVLVPGILLAFACVGLTLPVRAADVTRPAEVAAYRVYHVPTNFPGRTFDRYRDADSPERTIHVEIDQEPAGLATSIHASGCPSVGWGVIDLRHRNQ